MRGAHAAARLGTSLWVFGGFGERRAPAGGWSDLRMSDVERELWENAPGYQDTTMMVHNDMHILRTGQGRQFYPTVHHPDLIWSPLNYTSRSQLSAVMRRNTTVNSTMFHAVEEEQADPDANAFVRAVIDASTGEANATARAAPFKTRDAPSPRARAGHSLVAVGKRLILFGGAATAHIEFPLAEKFAVQGAEYLSGSLTPRVRGDPTSFTPAKPLDPVSVAFRDSSSSVLASEEIIAREQPANERLEEIEPMVAAARQELQRGRRLEAAAVERTRQWEGNPIWEASIPTTRYHMRGEATLTHVAHGDVHLLRDDLDTVSTATHISSDVYVQRTEQLSEVHAYDAHSMTWVELIPKGLSIPPREGHAATSLTSSAMVVFGGWRLVHPCGTSPTPCGEFLNDLHILHLSPPSPGGHNEATGYSDATGYNLRGGTGEGTFKSGEPGWRQSTSGDDGSATTASEDEDEELVPGDHADNARP